MLAEEERSSDSLATDVRSARPAEGYPGAASGSGGEGRSRAAARHRLAAELFLETLSTALGADPGLVASRVSDDGFSLRLSVLPSEDHLARAEALASEAILSNRPVGADGTGRLAGGLGMIVVTCVVAEPDGTLRIEGASGPEALAYLKAHSRLLARAAGALRCAPSEAPRRTAELHSELRELGARLAEARRRLGKRRSRSTKRTKKNRVGPLERR